MNLTPGNIYNGDCLELMHGIPDGSIDMILADLPYGTTACHWDSIIPLEPLWAHYKRIIKPRGAIVLTGCQPFTSVLIASNLDWFRQEMIWDKVLPVGFLDSNRRHLRRHENILLFSPVGYSTYNPIMETRGLPRGKGGNGGRDSDVYHDYNATKSFNNQYYPTTIISVSNGDRTRSEVGKHPTQKPVALFAYLIRTYTNPSELVLDNTAGSGTTAIAAIETGRDWLCIEKDAGYFQIAQERIREKLAQPFLPGIAEGQPVKVEQVKLFCGL